MVVKNQDTKTGGPKVSRSWKKLNEFPVSLSKICMPAAKRNKKATIFFISELLGEKYF